MKLIPFHTGGPLLGDSIVYISREADEKILYHLHRMDYITIIEPRQSGKTSLINHLISNPYSPNYEFVIRDLSAMRGLNKSEKLWYNALGRWIIKQLSFISESDFTKLPESSDTWEDFLAFIAENATSINKKVVIVLDEIGAMSNSFSTEFFSILRSIYSSRGSINLKFWKNITFIISGVYNPKNLILDDAISNWNIDNRIDLHDFTIEESKRLVNKLELSDDILDMINKRIYYWAEGQPLISQKLCYLIAETDKDLINKKNVKKLVDLSVDKFFDDDSNHLDRIKHLASSKILLNETKKIINKSDLKLLISLNDRHFYFTKINGLLNTDSNGVAKIRNRIYERALNDLNVITKGVNDKKFKYDVFISYSHKDKEWVHNKLLIELEKSKIIVCIDFRDFEPGEYIISNIEKAINDSKKTLLVLTPNWVNSEWANFESIMVQSEDPLAKSRKTIPLILVECDLPKRIKHLTCLDFKKTEMYRNEMKKLITTIKQN